MQEYTIIFRGGFEMGLRPAPRSPKNSQSLVLSEGAVPEDGILRSLDDIESFGQGLGALWPYPQVFVLKSMTLVCLETSLHEYADGIVTPVIAGLPAGSTWTVADYWPYVVATNGQAVVIRDPMTAEWYVSTDGTIPNCRCVADVNGQLFVGGLGGSPT